MGNRRKAHILLDGKDNEKKNIYLMCQLMISAKKEKMNEGNRIESDGAREGVA